jgi:hypothetical protein
LKEVGEPNSTVRVLREQGDLDKALAQAMRNEDPAVEPYRNSGTLLDQPNR